MDNQWQPYNLETYPGGVSSAVSPDLLPTNQVAWGMNADFRGSKIHTRPNIAQRMFLPPGLVQGLGYFNLQSGMIIVVIAGVPYRIRVGPRVENFSVEQIVLPWYNSPLVKQVWMCQTVESFLIQDGQSAAIIYDGTTARRANRLIPEVPIGLQMAYGNGRLWVAIEGNQLVAGDIRTDTPGSELSFTETQYLSGGGALSFGTPITALAFLPVIGTSDYGALAVMGRNYVETVRADITSRDSWASYPGFVTNALRNVGTPSGWTAVPVNQDIFFRDALGGLRSLNSGLGSAYNAPSRGVQGDSNISISREVSRLVDFDSQQLLGFSSGVYFNNRLLVTSSPFLNKQGGVSHKDLVCLDFAPVATMQGQTPPAYNGTWQGVNWTKLVSGEFNTQTRAFGVSSDEDGTNRLWEFDSGDIVDLYLSDGSSMSDGTGISNGTAFDSPIEAFVEYPRVDFQEPKRRKRLTRCDVWLSNIAEEVEVKLYWRPDNNQKWTFWDSTTHCATMTDPAVSGPHVWKNLLPEQRPLIKSFSIPDEIDGISTYDLATGFGFQIRIAWTGSLKIERAVLWATAVDDTDYASREGQDPACKANDVSGNEIRYEIPLYTPPVPPPPEGLIVEHGSSIFTSTPASFDGVFGPDTLILVNPSTSSSLTISSISCTWGISTSVSTPFSIPPSGSVTIPITISDPGSITFFTDGTIPSFEVDAVGLGCFDWTLWLESDYGVLSQLFPPIAANPGDTVAAWLDKSSQHNNALGTSDKPTVMGAQYGALPSVYFRGGKYMFANSYNYPQLTAFMVAWPYSTEGTNPNFFIGLNQSLGGGLSGPGFILGTHYPVAAGEIACLYKDSSGTTSEVFQSGTAQFVQQVITFRFNTTPTLSVNLTPGSPGTSNGSMSTDVSGIKLGIGASVDGSGNGLDPAIYGLRWENSMGAILLIPRAMTNQEIAYVQNILISKYSITV